MKIVFSGWEGTEPTELGVIEYKAGKVTTTGVGDSMKDEILEGVNLKDESAVKDAFVKAEDRYNGSYFNATLI